MRENVSPEEKLLALIRQPKKQKTVGMDDDNTSTVLSKNTNQPFLSLNKDFKPIAKASYIITLLRLIKPETILSTVYCVMIISLVFLIASFSYPLISLNNIKMPEVNKRKLAEYEKNINSAPAVSLTKYLETVSNKHLFEYLAIEEEQPLVNIADSELLKEISLVGIIMDPNPQAVIEDKGTQTTFYLNKGQAVKDARVIDIQQGKVILIYNDQQYELNL